MNCRMFPFLYPIIFPSLSEILVLSVVILCPCYHNTHMFCHTMELLQFSHQYISDFSSSVLSPINRQTLLFVLMLSSCIYYLSNISFPCFIMLFKTIPVTHSNKNIIPKFRCCKTTSVLDTI